MNFPNIIFTYFSNYKSLVHNEKFEFLIIKLLKIYLMIKIIVLYSSNILKYKYYLILNFKFYFYLKIVPTLDYRIFYWLKLL